MEKRHTVTVTTNQMLDHEIKKSIDKREEARELARKIYDLIEDEGCVSLRTINTAISMLELMVYDRAIIRRR